MTRFFIITLLLVIMAGCGKSSGTGPGDEIINIDDVEGISSAEVVQQKNLTMAIVRSIKVPSFNSDTLLVSPDTSITYCGNSSRAELVKIKATFIPAIAVSPYLDTLEKRFHGKVVLITREYEVEIERRSKKLPDSVNTWDYYRKNKIELFLRAKAITKTSVKLTEAYTLNDSTYSFYKVFIYDGNQWTWTLKKSGKEYNGE